MKRYSELKRILEELTPEQKKLVDSYVKSGTKAPEISAHIMHSDTIRIPLEEEEDRHKEPDPQVVKHLQSHGFTIPDFSHYKSGHAIDKHGRITSIGKVLHKTSAPEEIKQKFTNDPERASSKNSNLEVAISYHPYHVAGMSTKRGWTSCMDMDKGENRHYLKEDIKHGTHVAYLVNKEDKDIKNPIARIALKPFTEDRTVQTPYDIETHQRHRKDDAKLSLDISNHEGETNHSFHDFHVSPQGEIFVIGKHKNYDNTYHYMKYSNSNEYVGKSAPFETPDLAKKDLKQRIHVDTIKEIHPDAHTVLRPEDSVYGTTNSSFEKTVKNWAETNFPIKPDIAYKKNKKLYNDDANSIIQNFSENHLKEQGEHLANWSASGIKNEKLTRTLYDSIYKAADIEKIYKYADDHSKKTHTPDQREDFLLTRMQSLAGGGYSSESPTHEIVNKHIDNLRKIGKIEYANSIINKANKENYEAYMDKVLHQGSDPHARYHLANPHLRSKDIDAIIEKTSDQVAGIPSNKFEKHHIEQLVEKNNVSGNAVESDHYNPDLHEKLIDKNINIYKNQLNEISKVKNQHLNDVMGKSIKQNLLNISYGALPTDVYNNFAKKHINKKITDKLINFAKENNDFIKMTDKNFDKMRFATENSYEDSDLDTLIGKPHAEEIAESIIRNRPEPHRIDKMIDHGTLRSFDNHYSYDDQDWGNLFRSEKAKHLYGLGIKEGNPTLNRSGEREFIKSINDSHHDYIKNITNTRAFGLVRKNFSVIDKHIKEKNKLVAQTLHNIAVNKYGDEYKNYAEKNQKRIDKIQ